MLKPGARTSEFWLILGIAAAAIALSLAGKSAADVEERLHVPAAAAALKEKGGFPTSAEIERLLEPQGQTVRGTGVGGSAGG